MKQENIVKIASEDKKMSLLCDAEVTLGSLHDFLLSLKGEVVSRIQQAQKEEQEASDKVKASEEVKEEVKEEETK